MSMFGGRNPQGLDDTGQTVASFPTYEAAQKAVSSLIAAEIPAREIAIVGQGLRSIERVTGRLGYATAARSGAINGLLLGMLFAAIFVLGTPDAPIQLFIGVLLIGIALGMLLALITYSFVRRRRDFASVMQVLADHYEVTVTSASFHRAQGVLGPRTVVTGPPREAAAEAHLEPPRYGERITSPVPPEDRPAAPESDSSAASPAEHDDDTRR